ncbi:MAG: hypothetical protein AAGH15_28620, partial [Myxococcota bacterium]
SERCALAALAFLALLGAGPARAEVLPAGSVRGVLLAQAYDSRPAADELRFGGGLLVDLWQPIGALRLGGAAGIAAIRSNNDDANDVFLPLGLSVALTTSDGEAPVAITGVARVGGWAGATNGGLDGGPWVGAGLQLDVRLDAGLHLSVGVDAWTLFDEGERRVFVLPGFGLSWNTAARPSPGEGGAP